MAYKSPVKLAQPSPMSGGAYRDPALIVDKSAEILSAGLSNAGQNFTNSYLAAKKTGFEEVKQDKKTDSKEVEQNNGTGINMLGNAFAATNNAVPGAQPMMPGQSYQQVMPQAVPAQPVPTQPAPQQVPMQQPTPVENLANTNDASPFGGQTFTISPAQMKANEKMFGCKASRDRSVKR
jgi:hypothetical protein